MLRTYDLGTIYPSLHPDQPLGVLILLGITRRLLKLFALSLHPPRDLLLQPWTQSIVHTNALVQLTAKSHQVDFLQTGLL